jgi:hypothetical protein
MSSPAVVPQRIRATKVRIADSALMAGVVSLAYLVLVLVSPRVFPEILAAQFERGVLTVGIALLALALNLGWYLRIARIRQSSLSLLTVIALVMLTLVIAACFSVLVNVSLLRAQVSTVEQQYLQVTEEILIYTYIALVAAIFLPYLVLRLTQDFVTKKT